MVDVSAVVEGLKVTSTEHPEAIGEVMRVSKLGASIYWATPRSRNLPFGHSITEHWTIADFSLLTVIAELDA